MSLTLFPSMLGVSGGMQTMVLTLFLFTLAVLGEGEGSPAPPVLERVLSVLLPFGN